MKRKLFLQFLMSLLLVSACSCPRRADAFDVGCGDIHGFISQGYFHTSKNNFFGESKKGSFEFNEVGINYQVDLTDELRAGIQFFSRDLGEYGRNNKVIIDWALFDYQCREWLGIRVGKVKMPIGLHNRARDVDAARTWILLPQSVYTEAFRDILIAFWGVDVYGLIPMGCVGDLEYEAYYGTVTADPDEKIFKDQRRTTLESTGGSVEKNVFNKIEHIYGTQLTWSTPLEGLRIGASYSNGIIRSGFDWPSLAGIPGMDDHFRNRLSIDICVGSIEYACGPWKASGEYARIQVPQQTQLFFAPAYVPVEVLIDIDVEAYYLALEYNFLECWTVGSYYSVYYPFKDNKGASLSNWQKDFDISLRWDINEYLIAKLEWHRFSGVAHLSAHDNPNGYTRHWHMGLAKVSVSF